MDRLNQEEIGVISKIVNNLPLSEKQKIIDDINNSKIIIENEDRSIIKFQILNYIRPSSGQVPYDVEGQVFDSDGAKLSVILYVDSNFRILEFELVKYDDGPVINPVWETFCIIK
ncbi:MAG: hypothetical protein WBQ60_10900 [Asticcacaulis sp.]